MNKNPLKCFLCLFAIAAVAPDYAAYGQDKKSLTRSVTINNGDTTVNGKKFSELNKEERADLTLFPNFSSGKMTLSFNLASRGSAKISVLDSEMKSVFTDEAANFSGNYVKQLTLPKNGVYYVSVSQNGNWFVKRLVKE